MPKISVVVPLYNKALHISRAIHSVLSQSCQDFEILVVNDASTDGGEGIVADFKDARIRLLHRDKPGPGGHAARNMGIKESRSDLIAFLDADDEYKPAFLETILRLRKNFPEAGAYSTAYEFIEEAGILEKSRFVAIPPPPWEGLIPNYFEAALGDSPVWTSATAIPKQVFDKVGLFPEGTRLGGDLDMWLRVALEYRIAFSTSAQSIYHREATNRICQLQPPVEEYLFAKTARQAIQSGKLSDTDSKFLGEYVHKMNIQNAAHFICIGKKELGLQRLEACDTQVFRGLKSRWVTLAQMPHFVLNIFLFIKLHLINRVLRRVCSQ
jgi:glycosyltransferase involved in cell wall biosynthesis